MEPILIDLMPNGRSDRDDPHEGEEFGYVLSGKITLVIGDTVHKAKKGDSFYFVPSSVHFIKNTGASAARIIWVSSPPNF